MTKNFKSYVLSALAVAAIAFSGCSKNDEGMTPTQKKDFSVVLSGASTKTTNSDMSTLWAAGDAINLFHCVAGEETPTYVSDGEFTTSETGATATFTGTLAEGFDETKTYNWYAIYPYTEQITTPANRTTSGYVVVGSKSSQKQSQEGKNSTAHICGSNYPVVGVIEKLAGTEKPSFTMKHLTTLVAVNVKNGTSAPITISSVALTADPGDVAGIVGTYGIDFASSSSPVFTPSGDKYVSNTATLEVKNCEEIAPNTTAKFYLAIRPFVLNEDDKLTLSVTGPNGSQDRVLTATKNYTFEPGKCKTINFTYDKSGLDFEDCATINTLAEAAGSTEKEYLGSLNGAVVSFVPATNTAVIKDASGSALIYLKDHGLKQGQYYTGTVAIKVKAYQGVNEITAIDATFEGTGAVVNPEDLTIANLIGNYSKYQNAYAKVTNLEVTAVDGKDISVTDGSNNYIVYTNYDNSTCVVSDIITVIGTITRHNTTEEIKVWKESDLIITSHAATSHKITYTQPTVGGSITVSVDGSNITSGADIAEEKIVTLTATPASGYRFVEWTVTGATVANKLAATTTFKVGTSDVSITATFNRIGDEVKIIVDGSTLTSTATTAESEHTFGGVPFIFSDGAKKYTSTDATNYFINNPCIMIGKTGKYIYNKTAIPGRITKFEIYANYGASAKVSVGVNFSSSAISEYNASATNTYKATLSELDKVYDCSAQLPTNCKYFWYQVTNNYNSQVQFRITYIVE